jgi:hypothetical protein
MNTLAQEWGEAIINSEIQEKLESIIKLLLRIGRDADTTGDRKYSGITERGGE